MSGTLVSRRFNRWVSAYVDLAAVRAPWPSPKFPRPQEGMALISLTRACLGAQAFWLQGEGDPKQIEGALLERGGRREFIELDRRV